MDTSCNNHRPRRVRVVYGNPVTLTIPLQNVTRQLTDGIVTETVTDFYPSAEQPVYVWLLLDGERTYAYQATVDGNIATVQCGNDLRLGTYSLEVQCTDDQGDTRRYFTRSVLQVVSATADALLPPIAEFDAETDTLDAAVYIYTKGDKGDTGTGIQSVVQTQESKVSSGINIWTMTLTDGTTSDFNVRNGEKITATVDETGENIIFE